MLLMGQIFLRKGLWFISKVVFTKAGNIKARKTKPNQKILVGFEFLTDYILRKGRHVGITKELHFYQEQFEDIKKQEGSWYYKIFNLGQRDGLEIRTITGNYIEEINEPSKRYLNVIRRGLKETTKWSVEEIDEYLHRFQQINFAY